MQSTEQLIEQLERLCYDPKYGPIIAAFVSDFKVKLQVTSRHGYTASPGCVLVSADYSNQEMRLAAVFSGDIVMRQSFFEPEILEVMIENELIKYANHRADLHTITTIGCFGDLFREAQEHEFVNIAKRPKPGKRKSPRDYSKGINFGVLYLCTAMALAELNSVTLAEAEGWIEGHKLTYPGYHTWSNHMGEIGQAQGWIAAPWSGRIRWTEEDRAGGREGGSAMRSTVNHLIQGSGVDMSKLGSVLIRKRLREVYPTRNLRVSPIARVRAGTLVHDEIVSEVPGNVTLDLEASFDKSFKEWDKKRGKQPDAPAIFIPIWQADEEAEFWAKLIKEQMEAAETEIFSCVPEEQRVPSAASYEIAPYWNH